MLSWARHSASSLQPCPLDILTTAWEVALGFKGGGETFREQCQVWTADECPLLLHVIADYWRTEGLGMGQGPEARSQEAQAEGRGLGQAWRLCLVQRRAHP